MFLPRRCQPGCMILWHHPPPIVCSHKIRCCWYYPWTCLHCRSAYNQVSRHPDFSMCELTKHKLPKPAESMPWCGSADNHSDFSVNFHVCVLTKRKLSNPTEVMPHCGRANNWLGLQSLCMCAPKFFHGQSCTLLWACWQWSFYVRPTPHHQGIDNGTSMADPHSVLHTLPIPAWTTFQDLWALSVQPNQTFSTSLSTEPWVSAPRHCAHLQVCVSAWEVWQHGSHQCWSLSVLLGSRPAGAHSSQANSRPLQFPICLSRPPSQQKRFPGWGNHSSFMTPSQGHRSHSNSFFPPLVLPSYVGSLSCNFSCMRTSATFQLLFCESCYRNRFFWCICGESELHIFLLCHLDYLPLFTFLMVSFEAQKFLILMMFILSLFLLLLMLLVSYLRNHGLIQDHEDLLLFSFKNFVIFTLIFIFLLLLS